MTAAAAFLLLLGATPICAPGQPPPVPEHYWRTFEGLAAPAALAFTADGRLLVAEADSGAIVRIDPESGVRERLAGEGTAAGALAFPGGLAVDGDGRLLVAETGRHRLRVLSAAGEAVGELGGRGTAPGRWLAPSGIAVAGRRLAVCDTENDRVQVLDPAGGEATVLGAGELAAPRGVAWLAGGSLAVADSEHHRVVVFDGTGKLIRVLGDWGPYPGLFARPVSLAACGARLFVCDRDNHRIQVFEEGDEPVSIVGRHALRPREGEGKLHYPDAIAVSPDGRTLAVAEIFEGRVQLFRSERTHPPDALPPLPGVLQGISHFGTCVAADGALLAIPEPESRVIALYEDSGPEPRLIARIGAAGGEAARLFAVGGLWLDEAERLLAATDPVRRRLVLMRLRGWPQPEVAFDPTMAIFVRSVDLASLVREKAPAEPRPGALARGRDGSWYVADIANDVVWNLSRRLALEGRIGRHGDGPGELSRPSGLALSPDGGTLYVVDAWNRRVQRFAPDGTPGGVLATGGEPLVRPDAIAIGPGGDLFLSDVARSRVLVLAPGGGLRRAFGSPGLGRTEFLRPRGLAFDRDGRLVVIDHANHRGMRFDPDGHWVGAFGPRLYTRPARLPASASEEEGS